MTEFYHRPVAADPQVARMIRFKAKLMWELRKYLYDHGALEIPMPILQRTREGAPVAQWLTVHPHTGQRLYLRHCMEDHLRRASVAHRKVFEIGKAVRADVTSSIHAQEFVVLELVFRGLSYEAGVDLVKSLLSEAVAPAADSEYSNGEMFRHVTVRTWDEIFEESTGLSANSLNIASCESWLKTHDVSTHQHGSTYEVLEGIMKYAIEPACARPTIVTYFPRELQHVCDVNPLNGRAMRVESILHGVELSDGGVKFPNSGEYRRVYVANAEYRRDVLGLDGNELPEDFFADLDAMNEQAFTTGLGIDRITALVAGCDIKRALIFPEG